jgi:hypothetical protein
MQALMEIAHIAAVIVWAALRARPRPELINARPAHASGAIRRQMTQATVWESENT